MSTSGPAHRVQSAVVEYGYPQGHLGHLSPEEDAAFKNFKVLLAEKGYYKPGNEEGQEASHDDPLLLRFLRARRFVVLEAWKQFQDTEDWRKANQLDQLYETIDLEHYEETRRLYPQWTGRRDRRGIPVYVYEVKHLNSKTMAAYEKSAVKTKTKASTDGKTSPKLLRLFALYENLTRFVMPLCTALTDRDHPRTPITQSNNIVDISGVGLKQFWNLRTHMQDASTLATAHYPETLDRIFIIGAPAFFPTVWGWIKKWFDPITTSKIFILSSADMQKTLESFIDPVNIPKKYGGQLDFHFGDMPVLDPAYKDIITFESPLTDFPRGPMYWIHRDGDKEMEALAVGTVEEKERKEKVCTVKKMLRDDEDPAGAKVMNGHVKGQETLGEELRTIPTAAPSLANTEAGTNPNVSVTTPMETPAEAVTADSATADVVLAVQEGKLVPASRPEPVRFVTANDGLNALSLNEKTGNVPNGAASVGADGGAPIAVLPAELVQSNGKAVDGEEEKTGLRASLDKVKEKIGDAAEKAKGKVGV